MPSFFGRFGGNEVAVVSVISTVCLPLFCEAGFCPLRFSCVFVSVAVDDVSVMSTSSPISQQAVLSRQVESLSTDVICVTTALDLLLVSKKDQNGMSDAQIQLLINVVLSKLKSDKYNNLVISKKCQYKCK